ncbi:molecular chaperone [Polyrhizophydium stewartii]|uniref:Molecular chaperone n=1 Tax=Polyrhizophydium stewartii TaxID=2732419 RepID=A0ABR4N5R4_9FUNG
MSETFAFATKPGEPRVCNADMGSSSFDKYSADGKNNNVPLNTNITSYYFAVYYSTQDCSGNALAATMAYLTLQCTPYAGGFYKSQHCWKCNHYDPTSTFFCKNTSFSVILPTPDPVPNFFNLLQLDLPGAPWHGFTVSTLTVKRAFLSLQQRLHPDNFSTKSDQERTISETSSMLVNRAYQTLRDPLSRAVYILDPHGITVPETPSAADRNVLLHVVQALEEIEDADLHADPDAIKDLVASNARRIEDEHRVIADAFVCNEPEVARDAIVRLKY